MAAMLVVKNNSLPLRWEKKFIFIEILPTWPPCHVGEIEEYWDIVVKHAYTVIFFFQKFIWW